MMIMMMRIITTRTGNKN